MKIEKFQDGHRISIKSDIRIKDKWHGCFNLEFYTTGLAEDVKLEDCIDFDFLKKRFEEAFQKVK